MIEKLRQLPRHYWIYAAILFIVEIVVFAMRPDMPGLYEQNAQLAPIAVAVVSLFIKKIRSPFSRYINTYGAILFIFLALDYLTVGHAGLYQLTATFIPMALYWLFCFARWNVRTARTKGSLTALTLSCFAWGLYAFAYPPLPLGPAALLLLVPWFIVLNRYSRSQALFATFWSAFLYNAINYYWIYNVMHVETAPSGLILFGLILLIAYFSAYNTLAAYTYTLANKVTVKGHRILLPLFPIFYAGLEMTRTRGDFSFPWSHLGYAFGNHVELLQMLSWIGIFGYTFLIVASNQAVAHALSNTKKEYPIKKLLPVFAIPAVIFVVLLTHGICVLSSPEAEPFHDADNPENPSIAMVQPSIEQGAKWSKDRFDSIVSTTLAMVQDSVPEGTNLTILAETAVPDYIRRQPQVVRSLDNLANQKKTSILVGALDYQRNAPGSVRKYDIYNAAFLFPPKASAYKRYIKKHLVPFSERIPFDDIFPILNYVDLGEGDFVPGKETPVYAPYKWTPYICYDAIFGDLVREAIRHGSRLMVNITNDGWFGRSTAPYQHLNLVRYRAIENGMPVARLANSGISSFIDQYGHFDKNTPLFTNNVIIRKMPLKTRDTLYSHIGDTVETLLLIFFAVYFIAAFALSFRKAKKTIKA